MGTELVGFFYHQAVELHSLGPPILPMGSGHGLLYQALRNSGIKVSNYSYSFPLRNHPFSGTCSCSPVPMTTTSGRKRNLGAVGRKNKYSDLTIFSP